MKYNKQYALLMVKTETIERLLCKAEGLQDQINRYKEEDINDKWYQEQIANLEIEINATNQLIDLIAK